MGMKERKEQARRQLEREGKDRDEIVSQKREDKKDKKEEKVPRMNVSLWMKMYLGSTLLVLVVIIGWSIFRVNAGLFGMTQAIVLIIGTIIMTMIPLVGLYVFKEMVPDPKLEKN